MSGSLIISLVVVFVPMLCLIWFIVHYAWVAEEPRPTQVDPSADEWRWRRTDDPGTP